jgi:signal transduction histidine kinase
MNFLVSQQLPFSLLVANVFMCSALILIGTFVVLSNTRSKVNKFFFLNMLSLSLWFIIRYLSAIDESMATIWLDKLSLSVSPLIAVTFFYFAYYFLKESRFCTRVPHVLIIGPAVVTLFLSYSNLYIRTIASDIHGNFLIELGPLYVLNTAYITFTVAYGTYLIYSFYKISDSYVVKKRLRIVIAGILVALAVNIINDVFWLIVIGKQNIIRQTYVTFAGVAAYALAIAYAILKHKLFSVRYAVARTIAYFLLFATTTLVYGTLIILASGFLFGYVTSLFELTLTVVTISFTALTLPYLKKFYDKLSNRVFYKNTYDVKESLDQLTDILISNVELQKILDKSLSHVVKTLHASTAYIVVFKDNKITAASSNNDGGFQIKANEIKRLPDRRRIYIVNSRDDVKVDNFTIRILDRNGCEVLVSLVSAGKRIGILAFGPKLNGDAYTKVDESLLTIFSKNLAMAVQSAEQHEEIKKFADTLQNKVANATKELVATNNRLRELSQAKDEFIAMASHQLLPQLSAARGFMELLERNHGKNSPDVVRLALANTVRMNHLVADMLNVSKIQSGELKIVKEQTDIIQLISSELHNLQYVIKRQCVVINFLHPDHLVLELDPIKFREALFNIIDNAIQYSPPGGTVNIRIHKSASEIILEISDQGIGIPKTEQSKLFSRFFRASNATTLRPAGSGIGLYVTKKILDEHGFVIKATSEENKGTEFRITIPITQVIT